MLLKNSSIYLVSNIAAGIIPFLIIPILTSRLTIEEYGQIGIFQVLITIFLTLTGATIIGSSERKYFDKDSDLILDRYIGVCVKISFILICFFGLISILFKSQLIYITDLYIYWILAALLSAFMLNVTQIRLGQWQVRNVALKYGLLQVSQVAFISFGTVFLLLILSYGPEARVISQILVSFIFMVFSIFSLRSSNLFSLKANQKNKLFYSESIRFGLPLVPHAVCILILSVFDRFYISKSLGMESVGIYVLAVQVAMLVSVFFDSVNKAFVPWLFEMLSLNELPTKIRLVKFTYIWFFLIALLIPIPFLLGPWIIEQIATNEYSFAGEIIGWICLGHLFGGMYAMVTNYIIFSKKTIYTTYIAFVIGSLNIILMVFLISIYGLIGAGYAFSISMFLRFLLTWYFSNLALPMPWRLK